MVLRLVSVPELFAMRTFSRVSVICIAALVFSACAETERFEPSPSTGAYCVPLSNLVDAPDWLASADLAETGGGFAFSACSGQEDDCNAPAWLGGGVVESTKPTIFGRSVGEMLRDGGALAADIKHASRIASLDGVGLIAVERRGEFGSIYVFREASANSAVASSVLGDLAKDDVLLASCMKPRHVKSDSDLQGGDRFDCRRAFEREGMLIQYGFSVESLPDLRDADDRDKEVYSFLARWQCQ